jgi:hypothetical protein
MDEKNDTQTAGAQKKRKRDNLMGPDVLLAESKREQKSYIAVQGPVCWSGVPLDIIERGADADVLVRTEPGEPWGDDAEIDVAKDCMWTTGTIAAVSKTKDRILLHVPSRKAEYG